MDREERIHLFKDNSMTLVEMFQDIHESVIDMNETAADMIDYIELYRSSSLVDIMCEGAGGNAGSKIRSTCNACKTVLTKLRGIFKKISGAPLKFLKSKIDKITQTYGEIKAVSAEAATIQDKCFKLLKYFLQKAKEYVQKVKNAKGWEKGMYALEIISNPIPIPFSTTTLITLHSALRHLEAYIHTFDDRKIDAAIGDFERVIGVIDDTNNPKIASDGAKLLNKLKQCLNIAVSQTNKIYGQLQSAVKKHGK